MSKLRMMILSFVLMAIFAGFIAIETIKTPSASATTSTSACQYDPSIPQGFEIQPGKHARPGQCVVVEATDRSFSIVAVSAKVLRDPLAASNAVRVWTNFDSIDSARRFACERVRSIRTDPAYAGFLVSTDLRCFTLHVGGLVRN